ncbi:MAG: hypothetical protein RMK57_17030, partial [Bryobacterales bacterium]|nr:hypothetical protein [Bryobacterales bacterium]
MAPEAELAREAIQNSCDAAREQERRVRIAFRIVTLESPQKSKFLRSLGLVDDDARRFLKVRLAPDNCLSSGSRPLKLIFIEDYNTVGLRGAPHDPRSHFHRLLLSVGDTAKVSTLSSGGSYGYGKSALSLNSKIRTVVAYSAFEPDQTGDSARLMACAYLDAHEFEGKQFTGRGWFGLVRHGAELIVDPLRNDDAHGMADELGFASRRDGRPGTSILIVDSGASDPEKLLKGIEDWWWPRIVDEELEVEIEADGQKYCPRPKTREHLLPFIQCYLMAVGRAVPTGAHEKSDRFNRLEGLALGTYAFQMLDPERANQV